VTEPRRSGFNPLRNESDAFRVLVYAVAALVAVVGIVLIVRALT
jgi:hypothetical protein